LWTENVTSRKAITYIPFEPIGLSFYQTAIVLHKTPLYHSFYTSPTCQSILTIVMEKIIVYYWKSSRSFTCYVSIIQTVSNYRY